MSILRSSSANLCSSYGGADQWQLEGVQPGGIRSGMVYGTWTSVLHEETGPVGPFLYAPEELCTRLQNSVASKMLAYTWDDSLNSPLARSALCKRQALDLLSQKTNALWPCCMLRLESNRLRTPPSIICPYSNGKRGRYLIRTCINFDVVVALSQFKQTRSIHVDASSYCENRAFPKKPCLMNFCFGICLDLLVLGYTLDLRSADAARLGGPHDLEL